MPYDREDTMAKRTTVIITLVVSALVLVGCSDNFYLTYRTLELVDGKGPSVITDAKQRIITNIDIVNESISGQVLPKRIICAEPSPDVAQGVTRAISAGLSTGKVSASFGFSAAATVAQLGERMATIQLLRDMGYRNCEAYANGVINSTSYTILNSRLNKTIVTLLSSEVTAGALGRALAQIGGTAKSDSKASGSVKPGGQPGGQPGAQPSSPVAAPPQTNTNTESSTDVSANAGQLGTLGQILGNNLTNVSADLRGIHRQFMEDNSFTTLLDACVATLNNPQFNMADIKKFNEEENKNINKKDNDKYNVLSYKNKMKIILKLRKDKLKKISAGSFGSFCLVHILPAAREIAKSESDGRVALRKLRAGNLSKVESIIRTCAKAENKETAGCKNLGTLLATGG